MEQNKRNSGMLDAYLNMPALLDVGRKWMSFCASSITEMVPGEKLLKTLEYW